MKRRIAVVTTSRADYGIYYSLLQALQAEPSVELLLLVSGMHLESEFGHTVSVIESDGFPIAARIPTLVAGDGALAIAQSIGRAVTEFAGVYSQLAPDLIVVLGDRYEMLGAALASVPLEIPLAHIHGGESTFGVLDESYRHALTKLSHLHFAATEEYARRIRQLGEQAWRVTVSGAPGLDSLLSVEPLAGREFVATFGLDLDRPTLLVTMHPPSSRGDEVQAAMDHLLSALPADHQLLVTAPNADAGGRLILERWRQYAQERPDCHLVANLGRRGYATALRRCRAMVGNSSSGIIEAPSFGLPVVNIGDRQEGRSRGRNVIDCPDAPEAIAAACRQALSEVFRESLQSAPNPYGDGRAARVICRRLVEIELGPRLLKKLFVDWSQESY